MSNCLIVPLSHLLNLPSDHSISISRPEAVINRPGERREKKKKKREEKRRKQTNNNISARLFSHVCFCRGVLWPPPRQMVSALTSHQAAINSEPFLDGNPEFISYLLGTKFSQGANKGAVAQRIEDHHQSQSVTVTVTVTITVTVTPKSSTNRQHRERIICPEYLYCCILDSCKTYRSSTVYRVFYEYFALYYLT